MEAVVVSASHAPWWAIRVRLQMQSRMRELALFALGIDSKLRDHVTQRAIVLQQKTQRTRGQ